jgi:D-serine deaminase-like pyridoxal phosphate-dependent protein
MELSDLDTPVLTADLDAVERNIARMQAYCDEHGIALRPHIKTHKLPELARLQLDAGACGITCQKLGEAEVMADAGIDDILISFPLVGETKAERLAALARRITVSVVGDSATVATASPPCSRDTGSRSPSSSSATRATGAPACRRRRTPPSSRRSSRPSTACASPG